MVDFLQLGDGTWASQHFKVEFILYLSLRALCETEQAWSMQMGRFLASVNRGISVTFAKKIVSLRWRSVVLLARQLYRLHSRQEGTPATSQPVQLPVICLIPHEATPVPSFNSWRVQCNTGQVPLSQSCSSMRCIKVGVKHIAC
jgi:hypothetical protein